MANEISIDVVLSVFKAAIMNQEEGLSFNDLAFTMTGNRFIHNLLLVTTTEIAIPLGSVTAPHWSIWLNKDATNYLEIRPNTAVADLARLYPGEPALIPLAADSVPYGIANVASCLLEYIIFDY